MASRSLCLITAVGVACSNREPLTSDATSALTGAPNVLVVSLDTLRSDHLPLYGYHRDTAPTLSRLAAEGAYMTQTWSQAPQTDGTHAAMFTGRYASTHGKFTHNERLPDREVTFAEHFQESGYRTWAVATSLKFDKKSGFSQGFDDWELWPEGPVVPRGDNALARALEQMDADADRPWLGFVHLFDIHAPYTPPEPHRAKFLTTEPALEPRNTVRFIRKNRRAQRVPPKKLRSLVELYDGGIHHADDRVSTLWTAAKQNKRDTIIVITSDHGEAFHEHGYLGHSEVLWEEVMRIPWIVWHPKQVRASASIDAPAQSVDLFPTIVDLAGLPMAQNLDGQSFGDALRGSGPPPSEARDIVLQSATAWGIVRTIDGSQYKLTAPVRAHRRERLATGKLQTIGNAQLYNLTRDPDEQTDISEAHSDVALRLVEALKALGSDDPMANSESRGDLSEAELEGLRAIGYVE